MSKDHYRKIAEKWARRKWADVTNFWLDYLPDEEICFSPPTTSLEDNPEFKAIVDGMKEQHYVGSSFSGFHQTVLIESLFAFVRGVNVLANSQLSSTAGYCVWSLSNAYHAAYFFANGIMALAGIQTANYKSPLVADIWAAREFDHKQLRNQKCTIESIRLSRVSSRSIDHVATWIFFSRIMKQLKLDDDLGDAVEKLNRIDDGEFAVQRNQIHYSSSGWLFGDELFHPIMRRDFGAIQLADSPLPEPSQVDFTLRLAFLLGAINYRMLEGLHSAGAPLSKLDSFEKAFTSSDHRLWHEACDQWRLCALRD